MNRQLKNLRRRAHRYPYPETTLSYWLSLASDVDNEAGTAWIDEKTWHDVILGHGVRIPMLDHPAGPPLRVSIITTCKGRLKYLKKTLPAMLDQGADEVIVVDYACPDGAGDWVQRKYGNAVKVIRVPKVERDGRELFIKPHAVNVGAAFAEGKYLALVDSDMLLDKGWLNDGLERIEAAGAVIGRHVGPAHDDEATGGYEPPKHGTCIVKAAAFHKARGFNERLLNWGHDDDDFYLRVEALGSRALLDCLLLTDIARHNDAARTRFTPDPDAARGRDENKLICQMPGPVNPNGYGKRLPHRDGTPDLTIITPIGGSLPDARHDVWRVFERWLWQQDFPGVVQHIVADDGITPTLCRLGQEHVRRQRVQNDPSHTICQNMLEAMPQVRGERLTFWEFDDYAAPHYLSTVVDLLDNSRLVGQTDHRIYHLPLRKFHQHKHEYDFATLSQTAMWTADMDLLNAAIMRQPNHFSIDVRLWKLWDRGMHLYTAEEFPAMFLGFKGLATINHPHHYHKGGDGLYTQDDDAMTKLRAWIGDAAAEFYAARWPAPQTLEVAS